MSDHKRTYEVTISSPHGKQAIEQFRHYLDKLSSEAWERWGIDISIERVEETEHSTEFN